MVILGLNCTHDASCCLIRDDRIIADVQEERFTRIKHCSDVPLQAMRYCLKAAGIQRISEVDFVALGSTRLRPELAALLELEIPSEKGLIAPVSGEGHPLKCPLYYPNFSLGQRDKLQLIEHHLAHAASAHYTRGSAEECLVFTIDGIGNAVSTAVWHARGSTIVPLVKHGREVSFGWAYSVVTEALGWQHGDGEGKTMGLAPYGDAAKCQGVLDKYFPVFAGTELRRPATFGKVYRWSESGAYHWHLDESIEVERLCQTYGRENIAAEAQRKLEEAICDYVYSWLAKTGIKRAAFSGGLFLNVKLNQKIWQARQNKLIEQHIYPNPGDSGLALGSALYIHYQHHAFSGAKLESISWGPEYDDDYIESLVKQRGLAYETVDDPSLCAANLLAGGLIVGWFQGRMESGPRALGNRSILMSPQQSRNKDIINSRVKFREGFRPFCPSLLWEKASEYLLDARDEYFMITSFDVNPAYRDRMPAVVHVDGTVRPQTVKREINERYWRLIDEFGRLTGVYAVLNTSMNIKGEPIVNTPSEAIRLFFDSGLDAMILGRILITKPGIVRPKSETDAKALASA